MADQGGPMIGQSLPCTAEGLDILLFEASYLTINRMFRC